MEEQETYTLKFKDDSSITASKDEILDAVENIAEEKGETDVDVVNLIKNKIESIMTRIGPGGTIDAETIKSVLGENGILAVNDADLNNAVLAAQQAARNAGDAGKLASQDQGMGGAVNDVVLATQQVTRNAGDTEKLEGQNEGMEGANLQGTEVGTLDAIEGVPTNTPNERAGQNMGKNEVPPR